MDERYAREMRLGEIGRAGREAISLARVLCVGAGGLGHPAAMYLAATGVAKIGLVDDDVVEISNLHRQVLFDESDIGQKKVSAIARKLRAQNPSVDVCEHVARLNVQNAIEIFGGYDLILDCSDNFPTKFLVNDAAVKLNLPVVYAAISQFEGRLSVFWARRGPCYRCYMPASPKMIVPNCAEAGVIGAVAGIMGAMQALEAVKIIVMDAGTRGSFAPSIGVLHHFQLDTFQNTKLLVRKNPSCSVCSKERASIALEDVGQACQLGKRVITVTDFFQRRGDFALLIDVREEDEYAAGHIEGALNFPLSRIRGGESPVVLEPAKTLFYCERGARSSQALALLAARGFVSCLELKGGLEAYRNNR